MTTTKMTTKTKTSNGWSWTERDGEPSRTVQDRCENAFDGIYISACPACGQDCLWNAYDTAPLCECADQR